MYNMLYGENELADDLLKMINLTKEDCGRYRDCYLDEKVEKLLYTLEMVEVIENTMRRFLINYQHTLIIFVIMMTILIVLMQV